MIHLQKEGILLEPTELNFESHGVFNPAVIKTEDGQIHMFYRATTKANFSSIGHCLLKTPTEIDTRAEKPIFIPIEDYEKQGVEDPRIVNIDGTYYMNYTAYDGENAMGALATSTDLRTFHREGIITPKLTYHEFRLIIEGIEDLNEKYLRFVKLLVKRSGTDTVLHNFLWDKDVIMFPKKINGKFAMLHRIYPDIQVAYFNDVKELTNQYWKEYLYKLSDYIVISSTEEFEASYLGGGCPPLETSEGWLLIYHGVEDTVDGYVYHTGVALMDLEDPTKEIGRLRQPLFSPEHEWERVGVVKNVVFPTGVILEDDTVYIYYGAADKRIGVASVSLTELLNEIKSSSR